ncbi:RfaG Glycosyltransferase [uncultured Caudovirales phage]|uniref:RfaG Glycosyltransferase n=1 Tax=uncultured Caudovirales phage TaxID=2100421 RepID=A0A6J5NA62_9CAUD|nr:RfaG Glycosyltransferase [uncultured Caudovirales phage]
MRRRDPVDAARKRVVFMTPSLGMGGAERWIIALCRHFSMRINVLAIVTDDLRGALADEARRAAPVLPIAAFDAMKEDVEVVIAWGLMQLPFYLKGYEGRVIGVSHGNADLAWSRNVIEGMNRVQGIERVGVSFQSARAWPENARVIANGAEVERVLPLQSDVQTRAQFGLGEHKIALYFGRFSDEKRLNLLIAAADFLGLDWLVVLAGGPEDSLPAIATDRVKVLPPQERPGDLLGVADVFVMCSATEAHPMALTEAWLAGVPTVWMAWPLAEQIARQHPNSDMGHVLPLNATPAEIAAAIEYMDEEHFQELPLNAQQTAFKHYTACAMAHRWEEILL